MAEDEYLFDTVKWMFDNAREHVEWELTPDQSSTIKSVVRELSRRADYCKYLVDEVKTKQFSSEILDRAHGEVQAFLFMLEPFALKDEEINRDDLLYSHYQDITVIYKAVKKQYVYIYALKEKVAAKEEAAKGEAAEEDTKSDRGEGITRPPPSRRGRPKKDS